MTCRNHPDRPATRSARMAAATKQPDGTYFEDIPLCGPCGTNMAALGVAVEDV